MGGDDNEILLLTVLDVERWPKMSKGEIARRLARRIAEALT
jgi:phosphopantothenoylcysteine decarboxylase/phosphopantothenate--cysteine ligase